MKKLFSIASLVFSGIISAQCPTFSLNMSTTVLTCNTPSITVTAVNTSSMNGVSYFWTPGSFSGNPFTCTSPGNYSVMASTSTSTCVVTQTFAITSNTTAPNYSIVANPNTITCSSPVVTLSPMCIGSGTQCLVPVTYTWTAPSSATTSVSSPTYNAPGTYTLAVKNAFNGCIGYFTKSIGINTVAPSVTASGGGIICAGQSSTLVCNLIPGATYSWSSGATSQNTVVSPTISTTYTVWATSSFNGCTGQATVAVGVSPCTGIDEQGSINYVIIYPNPSNGSITLGNKTYLPDAELIILNGLGQEVHRTKITDRDKKIDISALAKGSYHYRILQNKQTVDRGKLLIE